MQGFDVKTSRNGTVLEIAVRGTLTAETFDALAPHIESAVREHAPAGLLFDMSKFTGWTLPAMWKDLVFSLEHRNDVERIALLGDRAWHRGMAFLCKPFTGAKLRHFDMQHVDQARAWLEARPESAKPHAYHDLPHELAGPLERFASDDGEVREAARHEIAERGDIAIPALTRAGHSPLPRVRWEAVKALTEIGSAATIPPLVAAMHRTDDVRWMAAERLRHMGRPAVQAVLKELVSHANSVGFCHGAHHMLKDLDDAALRTLAAPVADALDSMDPATNAPLAAHEVLRQLTEAGRPATA